MVSVDVRASQNYSTGSASVSCISKQNIGTVAMTLDIKTDLRAELSKLNNQAVALTLQAASLASATSRSGMLLKSGRNPSLSMSILAGVKYFPMVTTRAEPSSS